MKVLYLEDEQLLGKIVKESLESRGLDIDWFTDGKQGKAALDKGGEYDIAVLDVQMPGEGRLHHRKTLTFKFSEITHSLPYRARTVQRCPVGV